MDASCCATLLQRVVIVILFFLAVGFSITNAVVFLHVFSWLRKLVCGLSDKEFHKLAHGGMLSGFRGGFLGRLFHCHACMGFWIGVLLSLRLGGIIVEHVSAISQLEGIVADGFLLSGFNFCLWVVFRKLGVEEM